VKKHIHLLHTYNEIKDGTQKLIYHVSIPPAQVRRAETSCRQSRVPPSPKSIKNSTFRSPNETHVAGRRALGSAGNVYVWSGYEGTVSVHRRREKQLEGGKLDQATCIDIPILFSATDRQCTPAEQLTVVLKPKQRR